MYVLLHCCMTKHGTAGLQLGAHLLVQHSRLGHVLCGSLVPQTADADAPCTTPTPSGTSWYSHSYYELVAYFDYSRTSWALPPAATHRLEHAPASRSGRCASRPMASHPSDAYAAATAERVRGSPHLWKRCRTCRPHRLHGRSAHMHLVSPRTSPAQASTAASAHIERLSVCAAVQSVSVTNNTCACAHE